MPSRGRLTPQPRSLKVDFDPRHVPDENFIREAASAYNWTRGQVDNVLADRDRLAIGFSVDVVPAVTWDGHYGIPEVATMPSSGDRYRTGRWRRTNPVGLTDRTRVFPTLQRTVNCRLILAPPRAQGRPLGPERARPPQDHAADLRVLIVDVAGLCVNRLPLLQPLQNQAA
jgi:hypothetical protein